MGGFWRAESEESYETHSNCWEAATAATVQGLWESLGEDPGHVGN